MKVALNKNRIVIVGGLLLIIVLVTIVLALTGIVDTGKLLGTALFTTCDEVEEISSEECQALVAFYTSTNGDGWKYNDGWMEIDTPCQWYGVACDAGKVTSLYMYSNQLTGNLPSDIGDLPNLQWLVLVGNTLEGNLPVELADLIHLEWIVLSSNELSGAILDQIGALENLEWLILTDNHFSGNIPASLGNLKKLERLVLSDNLLEGELPHQLGGLGSLEWLVINDNNLTGAIPDAFGDLSSLAKLELAGNQLSGPIPARLIEIPDLQSLILDRNQLSGPIPPEFSDLAITLGPNAPEKIDLGQAGDDKIPQLVAEFGNIGAAISSSSDSTSLDVDYNKLYTDDADVIELLNSQNSDWDETQTIPPFDFLVSKTSPDGYLLSWTPIQYTGDGGYYEISLAQDGEGPFSIIGQTADKFAESFVVSDLLADVTYYFRIRTFTPAHWDQQNDLWSEYTPVESSRNADSGPDAFLYLPLIIR